MPWDPYWAALHTRWTGGVIKRPFPPLTSSWATRRPLFLSLALSLSLSLSLPLPPSTRCLKLMAGNMTKSSQCDKVTEKKRERGWERRGKRAISVGPYILIIQWWGNGLKIKTNGEREMISLHPDCWRQCLESHPDGYGAGLTVGAEAYCCPLDWPSWCHAW